MRRTTAVLAAVVTLLSAVTALGASSPASAATPSRELLVVSDSVVLGAVNDIHRAFLGWNVTIAGRQGLFADDAAELAWANRAAIGDTAVVAVGYNYPVWNPALFDTWIDQMLTRLTEAGAKRVYWITLRNLVPGADGVQSVWEKSGIYRSYPEANAKLAAAKARWPQLALVPWHEVGAGGGLTWDGIHLNPAGAKLMATLIHDEVYGHGRVEAGTDLRVPFADLPDDAVAAAVNVTVTGARTAGYVTLHACGTPPPLASNINVVPGQTVANLAIVPVGADKTVCAYASTTAHVVVDLTGAVRPAAGLTTTVPARLVDTRTGAAPAKVAAGGVTVVKVNATAGATAAVLNVTVTEPDGPGYATVYPCGAAPPLASNLNVARGETRAGLVIAPLAADGTACITTSMRTHLVVDQQGSLAGAGYRAVTPQRLLDTRDGGAKPVAAGGVARVALPAAAVTASVTVTADQPLAAGYVTAWPCGASAPLASTLNPVPGQATANSALVAGGELCLLTSSGGHLVVDVNGWFPDAGGFTPIGPTRIADTRDPDLV